jgi:hypothetical protein
MPSMSFSSSRPRALLAGLAATIAVLSLLALPAVRAVADELLSVFRVQNVVFLPVSSDRIQQLANLNFDKNTLFVSQPTAEHPVAPRTVASAAEATSAVGYKVEQLSALPSAPISTEFQVNDPNKTQFQVNVASARQLLTLLDIKDVTIPDTLGTSPIVVDVPAFASIHYHGQNYDMTLHQGHSPKVTLPEGVDIAQLGKATLRVLGMTPQEAEATSQTIDWNNTLLFPFPKDTSAIRQVAIGNTTGMLVSGGGRQQHWQLYWQSGDTLYMLQASGTMSDPEMIAALTAAAESVN